MSAITLLLLTIVICTSLIDFAHVLRGGQIKNGLFGLVVRGVVNCTILTLLMAATLLGLGLAAVGAVLFGIVWAAASVLDLIVALYRKIKFSNWMLRLRAKGKNAEDRLELANAVAEGRRPVYGRDNRKRGVHPRHGVNKEGRIDVL